MTTIKSYSKNDKFASAYISALKTQFPFAIVSGILFLLLFVVVFFISISDSYGLVDATKFFKEYFLQGIYVDIEQSIVALVVLAVLALASTLAGLKYLHSKRTVDLYHSLPISRPKLLGANLLATFTAVLGPYLAIYLITMLIQLVSCSKYGCFGTGYFMFILADILAAMVYVAVIIAFIAFIAVNVGTIFDAFAVTMAFGFSPPLIYILGGYIWQSLVYGAYFEPSENLLCLSPFMFIYKIWVSIDSYAYAYAHTVSQWDWNYGDIVAKHFGLVAVMLLLGALAAVVLLVAAMVFYRRRKSEIAEQTQPRGVLQIIVKLIAAFIGGSVFFAIFDSSGLTAGRLFFVMLGAVSIGLIAELILSRGVRWIPKNLKWLLGAGAVFCLLLIGVNADMFGYIARVPSLDTIESVQVNYDGRFGKTDERPHYSDHYGTQLTDAESMAIVREAHSIAVEHRPPSGTNYNFKDSGYSYNSIRIAYKLKNGSTIKRSYGTVYVGANEKLVELETRDDFIRSRSALFWAEQNPKYAEVQTVALFSPFPGKDSQHANVLKNPEPLLSAIRQDMLEQSLEDITDHQGPALGFIVVNFKPINEGAYKQENPDIYNYFPNPRAEVIVTREYKRTLEVLRQLELNGNFAVEPTGIDDITEVVTEKSLYYESGYVSLFRPWDYDNRDLGVIDHKIATGESIARTDASSIKAIAQASKELLFMPAGRDGNPKYVKVFFRMPDDTVIPKVVKLDDLPPDIKSEILEAQKQDEIN